MGRIKGHYVWDDDNLSPASKRGGGLHQNLFDAEGNLKGHARFIPDDAGDEERIVVTESVYIPAEERRRSREDDELLEAIADVMSRVLIKTAAAARPHVEEWWRETVRPRIDAKRQKLADRRSRKKARKGGAPEVEPARPDMSLAEAQARVLAAMAAQAFGEEQMSLVGGANIVGSATGSDGLTEVQRSLADLPADALSKLLAALASNPAMLQEDNLARLASMMGPLERAAALPARTARS